MSEILSKKQFVTSLARGPLVAYVAVFFIFAVFLAYIVLPQSADSATSDTINFQGKIVQNSAGNEGLNVTPASTACVVDSGADTCTFRVRYYDAATLGTLLATETFSAIEIGDYDGVFNLPLGAGSFTAGSEASFTDIFVNNPDVYVEVGFDPAGGTTYGEVFSRMPVRAAPFAISANNIGGFTSDNFVQFAPGSIQATSSATGLIRLNQTGAGGLLQLQVSGVDEFVVGSTGLITTASVDSTSIVDGSVAFVDWTSNGCSTDQVPLYNGAAWVCSSTSGLYTASNGLTLTGTDFELGGTLTQDTEIAQAGFDFSITGGNVGIGTAASIYDLAYSGDQAFFGLESEINEAFVIRDTVNGENVFNVDMNNYAILFDETAMGYNFGIGTNSPGYLLDVGGNARFTGRVIGANAVNANEFVTKSQLDTVGSSIYWTRSGSYTVLSNIGDNVGIGTNSPSAKLDIDGSADTVQLIVEGNSTQTANIFEVQASGGGFRAGINNRGYAGFGTGTSNNAIISAGSTLPGGATSYGLNMLATIATDDVLYGGVFTSSYSAAASANYSQQLVAVTGRAYNFSTYTVNIASAVNGEIYQNTTGTITTATHFSTSVYNPSGTIVNRRGLYIGAASNVQTDIGILVSNLTASSGAYGIQSTLSAGTSRYNLYISGTADNYLNGNVGIGDPTPTNKLDVHGSVRIGVAYNNIAAPADGLIVAGNTGIGTSAPSRLLSITNDSNPTVKSTVTRASGGVAFPVFEVGISNGNGSADWAEFGAFGSADTNLMTYFYIGNVYNDAWQSWASNEVVINPQNSDIDFIVDSDISNNAFFLEGSSGNIGIGDNTPSYRLDVAGNVGLDNSLSIDGTTGDTTLDGHQISFTRPSANYFNAMDASGWFSFRVNGSTSVLNIRENGRVGIGTTNPGQELEVIGDGFFDNGSGTLGGAGLYLGDGFEYWNWRPGTSAEGYDLFLDYYNGGGYSNLLTLDRATGNLGLGVNPVHTFEVASASGGDMVYLRPGAGGPSDPAYINVNGRARFGFNGSGSVVIDDDNTAKNILLMTGGSTRLFVGSTGSVGINTSSPSYQFEVDGDVNLTTVSSVYRIAGTQVLRMPDQTTFPGTLIIGDGGGSLTGAANNLFIGFGAGDKTTTGANNVALGTDALFDNETGERNFALGTESLTNNISGSRNTAIGYQALLRTQTGNANTAIGDRALGQITTGNNNIGIGRDAGYGINGQNYNNSIIIGYQAGYGMITGADENTIIGTRSGFALTSGGENTLIGYMAGDNLTTGDNNILIGSNIDVVSPTADDSLNIGNLVFGTGLDGTGTTLSTGNIGIGNSAPAAKLSVGGDGAILAVGTLYSGWAGQTGAGTRMMWVPNRAAFRAGNVSGTGWDTLGVYSAAFGYNASATGSSSFAVGNSTGASGANSFAGGSFSYAGGTSAFVFGQNSNANGNYSIALGSLGQASADYAFAVGGSASGVYSFTYEGIASASQAIAVGANSNASGSFSAALGAWSDADGAYSKSLSFGGTAASYAETQLGLYSTSVSGNLTSYVATDRLLVVGNGTSSGSRSDALIILKNGNTTVGGELTVASIPSAGSNTLCEVSGVISACSSSLRYKQNISDLNLGLSEVMQLRPVSFNWKNGQGADFGFVAEEVNSVNPLFAFRNSDGQIEGVRYRQLTALIVGAIQEQQAQIDALGGSSASYWSLSGSELSTTRSVRASAFSNSNSSFVVDALGNLQARSVTVSTTIRGLNGTLFVDGAISADRVVTRQIEIDRSDASSASAGEGSIVTGQTEAVITSSSIKADSLIFITPVATSAGELPYIVVKSQQDGSFTVLMDKVYPEGVTFRWWVVQ